MNRVHAPHQLSDAFAANAIRSFDMSLSPTHPLLANSFRLNRQPKPFFDMHYALEFGFVLSGKMKRHYQHWDTELGPGQVWLCGIWEPHGYDILQAPCAVVIYAISPEMLAMTRFPEIPSFDCMAPFVIPPDQRPQAAFDRRHLFLALGRRALNILNTKPDQEAVILRLLLLETLLALCQHWPGSRPGATVPADRFFIVNRAVLMVFKSTEWITVRKAAQACGIRPATFTRLFREVMGITFVDFSLRYRLHGAKEQLLHSQIPIKAIAASWGFTDKSHFHHVFVSHYGCTPSEYRKRCVKV